jgi:integrase/recombinase XerD
MAIKRKRQPRPESLKTKLVIEHTGFYPYLVRYLETLNIRQYSEQTVRRRDSDLRRFIHWCDERGLDRAQDITKPILERYQKHLYYHRKENGQPLGSRTQNRYLSSVQQFFKWAARENHLLYNPASDLVLPKAVAGLPIVLSVEEVAHLMTQPDTDTHSGLRDRALLEVLYATGVRRIELCRLRREDLSLQRRTLFVRQGKGGKDRLLPLGDRAAAWVDRYLSDVRPHFTLDLAEPTLFLNDYGEPFRQSQLGDKVKRYLRQADIEAAGACHLLRHAMATHMLENGAETRYIQAMLGHASLETTQIYTHVSVRKLQAIHAATHPGEARETPTEGQPEAVGRDEAADNQDCG